MMENYFYHKSHLNKITYIQNYAVDKQNFIKPIKSIIKPIPWLHEKGISFIGLLLEDDYFLDKSIILINPEN